MQEPQEPGLDRLEPPRLAGGVRPRGIDRVTALLEVALCSGFPTQLALGATLARMGLPSTSGQLDTTFVVALAIADTVLLVGLILVFLYAHDESPQAVFFGGRPLRQELLAGIPLTFVALGLALGVLIAIRIVAPWLHTVDRNPLQDLMRQPGDIALFAVVVIVAGGVREELQRAFLLRRFEQSLGGGRVGVVITSATFGLGHYLQGADAMIATGLLGAFWAVVYLRRGSVAAPIVSHSGFNLLQLLQLLVLAT
jgi:membrane protease YdiL (CAAX protease family)